MRFVRRLQWVKCSIQIEVKDQTVSEREVIRLKKKKENRNTESIRLFEKKSYLLNCFIATLDFNKL